jgi:hypothetical protein
MTTKALYEDVRRLRDLLEETLWYVELKARAAYFGGSEAGILEARLDQARAADLVASIRAELEASAEDLARPPQMATPHERALEVVSLVTYLEDDDLRDTAKRTKLVADVERVFLDAVSEVEVRERAFVLRAASDPDRSAYERLRDIVRHVTSDLTWESPDARRL